MHAFVIETNDSKLRNIFLFHEKLNFTFALLQKEETFDVEI